MKIYKYILKLNHVENGKYLIIHLISPTSTSLIALKVGKQIHLFLKNLLECILNMYLINIIVIQLNIISTLVMKILKNVSTFNTLNFVYNCFFFMTRIRKLSISLCWHIILRYFIEIIIGCFRLFYPRLFHLKLLYAIFYMLFFILGHLLLYIK